MTHTTQTRHPWRATLRTIFAVAIGLLSLLPTIALAAGVDDVPLIAQALGVAAAVTRVLAIPGVDAWLREYVPWLASAPIRNEVPEAKDQRASLPPHTTFRDGDFR
ncbi:hypothetical protein [Verrucosispora sp. WMMD1129]|uniref:hypothetical protein n=1 Tax=Verrucosispora sp. WMMD1129 TaxID=3016093 RepID=UPI00249BBC9B|nr:hypothetical protein [Verrucosispora sp. WMMD1129]WFE47629.1 hypothetical protein O7624_26550 [Verrucosispora sp. WMMD1129]